MLAQIHAVVPQDGIGGGDVEKQVWQHPVLEVGLTTHGTGAVPSNRESNLFGLRAIQIVSRHSGQVIQRLLDSGLQISQRDFVVLKFGGLNA